MSSTPYETLAHTTALILVVCAPNCTKKDYGSKDITKFIKDLSKLRNDKYFKIREDVVEEVLNSKVMRLIIRNLAPTISIARRSDRNGENVYKMSFSGSEYIEYKEEAVDVDVKIEQLERIILQKIRKSSSPNKLPNGTTTSSTTLPTQLLSHYDDESLLNIETLYTDIAAITPLSNFSTTAAATTHHDCDKSSSTLTKTTPPPRGRPSVHFDKLSQNYLNLQKRYSRLKLKYNNLLKTAVKEEGHSRQIKKEKHSAKVDLNSEFSLEEEKQIENTSSVVVSDVDDPPPPISMIKQFVNRANVFESIINGHKQLSLSTGMFMSDLLSTCKVSTEKLPLILGNVANMWFGEEMVDSKTLEFLCPSSTQSSIAIERFHDFMQQRTKEYIGGNSIQLANLLLDESNKADNPLKCKILICSRIDDAIVQLGLKCDTAFSKKTKIAADISIQSMIKELGNIGCIKILSSTCDWFAEGAEAKLVMNAIDKLATNLLEDQEQDMNINNCWYLIPSKIYEGLNYNIAKPVRELRVRPCQAHNFERILNHFLDPVAQKAGLKFDATTLQSLYKIFYYLDRKLHQKYRVCLLSLYDNKFENIPKDMLNRFGNTAANRWLSREIQCAKLVNLLQIPAEESLVKKVKAINREAWKKLKKCNKFLFQTIFKPNEYSAYILSIYYFAHHLKNNSEGHDGCIKILGFLGSHEHRIALCVVASMLSIHRYWLSFANCKTEVNNAEDKIQVNSTRVIESPVFSRSLLHIVYRMTNKNWKTVLPNLSTHIETITNNKFPENNELAEECIEYWDNFIHENSKPMLNVALKYFRDIDVQLGWSISLVVDPIIGPSVAQGILLGIKHCMPQQANIIIEDDILPPILDESDYKTPEGYDWSLDDYKYAYPNMSYRALTAEIYNSFIINHPEKGKAIIFAYGLSNSKMIEELKQISLGNLRNQLDEMSSEENDDDHHSSSSWKLGAPVSTYFETIFKTNYPGLHECLTILFAHCSVTSTAVEAAFSEAKNKIHPNNSSIRNAIQMNHILTVKNPIVNAMMKTKKERKHSKEVSNRSYQERSDQWFRRVNNGRNCRLRALRNSNTRYLYFRSLWNILRTNSNNSTSSPSKIKSVRQLRKNGKRKHDLESSNEFSLQDLTQNAAHKSSKLYAEELEHEVNLFSQTKRARMSTFPIEPVDVHYEKARKMKKIEIIQILLKHPREPYKNMTQTQLNKMPKEKKNKFDAQPALVDYLTQLLKEQAVSIG